jgi:hypothetical protein
MELLLVGAGIFLTGWVAGKFSRRQPKPPKPQKPPQPICGCGHHRALHDEVGICQATVRQATKWDSYDGDATDWKNVKCPCQKYIGPVPQMQLWFPPALPELGE